LRWLQYVARELAFADKLVYFNTANYLPGRKNYLGGPVEQLWQKALDVGYLALHGTSHARSGNRWDVARWHREHATIVGEIERRLKLPWGWEWGTYPWGSRAPNLRLNAHYYAALARLGRNIVYDASLVIRPTARRGKSDLGELMRDLPWPFTMEHPLPPGVPRHQQLNSVIEQEGAPLWQVPVYAWHLRPRRAGIWRPSLDTYLWELYECRGEDANRQAIKDLLGNLDAHYRGNRAPFHIGLTPREYTRDQQCQRNTIEGLLKAIQGQYKSGRNIKFVSIPELLLWIDRHSGEREG